MGVNVHTSVNVKDMLVEPSIVNPRGELFKGFEFDDGEVVGESFLPPFTLYANLPSPLHVEADLVIFAVGITPRDELARMSGIKVATRGGIDVDDNLETSAKGIYAIGECASWRGNTYGLIAPGGQPTHSASGDKLPLTEFYLTPYSRDGRHPRL